ncbi:MAG: hypothetical protein QOI12_2547 [Alphaproteobacteria bacterium]|nr:hypothetical protein [Alphaproteobacteria bacterium]
MTVMSTIAIYNWLKTDQYSFLFSRYFSNEILTVSRSTLGSLLKIRQTYSHQLDNPPKKIALPNT